MRIGKGENMKKALWTPSEKWVNESNIVKFRDFAEKRTGDKYPDYRTLYNWSVNAPLEFWDAVWDYFQIIGDKPEGCAQKSELVFEKMNWFPGAKINYAENMLRYLDTDEEKIAFYGEDVIHRSLSGNEIRSQVYKMARFLKESGVEKGQVVSAYMPNLPETIIAMLATAAIGAIWCSCATDIGPGAAVDRLGQTNPSVLVTVDGYYYKGKGFDTLKNAAQIAKSIDSLKKVVVVHFGGKKGELGGIENAVTWDSVMESQDGSEITYDRYEYNHPMVIMFSSGTTGKPKCMVQSGMGLLLNQLKELVLMSDLKPTDRMLYITTCSWMMWNWQASALGTGASLVLYDGNPSYPDTSGIWKVIEKEKVSIFGLSASYIHALVREKFEPAKNFDLSALREISQTGSALSDAGFDYIYKEIKEDLFFNSIAGGTDINGCFAIGSPMQPVYAGELQAPGLGMKIECYDGNGKPIRDEEGELVCEIPAPSMPLFFWNDDNGERYHNAYFVDFPGVWRHGDYVRISSETGGISFCGRSDSVLKPSGVRIGTAEIYNQVEELPEIKESVVVGQEYQGDQRVILFVQLMEGYEFNDELVKKIKTTLRTKASPRHVPALIFEVSQIPHTMNGKKVESAITNMVNGRKITNRDVLSNPEALDDFESIMPKLQ